MKSNYKAIGELVHQVDVRNTDLKVTTLMGVNLSKEFMPSVANIVGTDLSKYKVVKKGQFACKLMSVGRDVRLPIAFKEDDGDIIISSAYYAFETNDESIAMSEYLMMCFSRDEFDRELWFNSGGDVRGGINWDTFSKVKIPVPSIEKQRELVYQYKSIKERICIKQKINDNLEATIQAIFKSMFIDYEEASCSNLIEFEFGKFPANWNMIDLDAAVDVRDGTHDSPSPTEFGKYLITSRHLLPYTINRSDAYYISEADYNKANERSKVEYGDILYSMIGTIGIISFITDKEIDFAIKNVGLFRTSQNPTMRYFILSYLKSKIVENYISSYMAGSTQSYVSLNVLRKIPLILPPDDVICHFEKQVAPLYTKMIENTYEISKLNDLKEIITTSMSCF